MRVLRNVTPTPEQLTILGRNRPGVEIIRGSAGSGKTTTAILRLRALIGFFTAKRARSGRTEPVRVLVLTYNRTLRGYVTKLVEQQAPSASPDIDLTVSTFSRWARQFLSEPRVVEPHQRNRFLTRLARNLRLPADFVIDEVDYVLGRFLPGDQDAYLDARRDGRGALPRMERATRQELLEKVIRPYQIWLNDQGLYDWHEFAFAAALTDLDEKYDVIVVDEAQDFSANQIRAILRQAKKESSITFVVDTAQRIYARGFTWAEVGLTIRPDMVKRLDTNYRNTKQIAKVAASICAGIKIDDDGTLPDFNAANRDGMMPMLVRGRYSKQADFAIDYIRDRVDLSRESVAFLHPKGWFREIAEKLGKAGISYVHITREPEWPEGSENVALCTMHSAKGLEFDHVIILGLNGETLGEYEDEEDDRAQKERRLISMAISRARDGLVIGYKEDDRPAIADYLDENLFEVRDV